MRLGRLPSTVEANAAHAFRAETHSKRPRSRADQLERTGNAKAIKRAYPHPVVVAGGSLAGFHTALSLAKLGIKVVVLESRLDPNSAEGKAKLAAGETSKVWGTRERTIVFDQHVVSALAELGVDVSGFPQMRYLQLRPSSSLSTAVDIDYAHGKGKKGNGRLDAATLAYARDISHQPLISEVEHALLAAARKNPNINVVFGAPVVDRSTTKTGVRVRYGNNQSIDGTMLVIADGGGKSSLATKLGIKRDVWARETIATATLQVTKDDHHPIDQAGSSGGTTENGWYGLNSDGRGTMTVNVRASGKGEPRDPLAVAADAGIVGTPKAPTSTFDVPLDRAQSFVIGNRTFIIGDAAVRGTPLYGFGGQFAFLWGQTIADMCGRGLDKGGLPTDAAVRWFKSKADSIATTRLELETGTNNAIDSSLAGTVSRQLSSFDFGSALGALDVTMRDNQLHLDVDTTLGRLTGKPAVSFGGGVVTLEPTAKQPITFTTQRETVTIKDGKLVLSVTDQNGVNVDWHNVSLKRTVKDSGQTSMLSVPHMSVVLPGSLTSGILSSAPGLTMSKTIKGSVALASGDAHLGPMHVRFHDEPIVNFWLRPVQGGKCLTMEFAEGSMTLQNGAEVHNLMTGHSGTLFGDALINAGARSAGIKRADFTMFDDGSAEAYYETDNFLAGNMTFDLSTDDIARVAGSMQQHSTRDLFAALQKQIIDFDLFSSAPKPKRRAR